MYEFLYKLLRNAIFVDEEGKELTSKEEINTKLRSSDQSLVFLRIPVFSIKELNYILKEITKKPKI